MLCLTCSSFAGDVLCDACSRGLSRSVATTLGDGLAAVAPFAHRGTARRLVHALKYRGVIAAARPLTEAMVEVLPSGVTALVPVPRARVRAIRFGVDPSLVLARGIAGHTGIPVVAALAAPLWWRRHAGRDRDHRGTVRFRPCRPVGPGSALVDDVLTTGATMLAAHAALQGLPTLVLTATAAGRVRGGEGRSAMEAK
jgi:predicted amidophosphoribosyltransferase